MRRVWVIVWGMIGSRFRFRFRVIRVTGRIRVRVKRVSLGFRIRLSAWFGVRFRV